MWERTYWVNFQVGEPDSASAIVAIGGCVGEGWPSLYKKRAKEMIWCGGAGGEMGSVRQVGGRGFG